MSIHKVNTITEAQDFTFLPNQSSILHTADTNEITVNEVNVIVDKPKRGDVMCITHYKNESGVDLSADEQEVVWIDGLSINPKQLSQELEPVGICCVVKGNKAIVRYKKADDYFTFGVKDRWEIPYREFMNNQKQSTIDVRVKLTNNENYKSIGRANFKALSRFNVVSTLNNIFYSSAAYEYSAELVTLNIDFPSGFNTQELADHKDEYGNYYNRIVINTPPGITGITIILTNIENGITKTQRSDGEYKTLPNIPYNGFYYKNNGFAEDWGGGSNIAKYYDFYSDSNNGDTPSEEMTSINTHIPVNKNAFTNNTYCKILRDNFSDYYEYVKSLCVKYPCGKGDLSDEFSRGKEYTRKLAGCTYEDINTGEYEILYPAANYAASISLNAPKLGKGKWWLPSAAEMAEIISDITYGTSFWETNPDIVNQVLEKLHSFDSNWSMLSGSTNKWTSTRSLQKHMRFCWGNLGNFSQASLDSAGIVLPITIYEF